MSVITQNHILNIVPGMSAPVVVHVSQGDSGVELEFVLVNGSEIFDPTGTVISVHGIRQDGTGWGPVACAREDGKIKFTLPDAATAVKGSGMAELSISNGEETVGTTNFAILVETATFPQGVTYANDVSVYEAILAYVDQMGEQTVANVEADLAAEIANRQAADAVLQQNINSEASTRAGADTTLQTNLNNAVSSLNEALTSEVSARTSADSTINARIDELIAPSGEAPSAAEVTDARIGADGIVYASLGKAIRGQIDDVYANTVKTTKNILYGTWENADISNGNFIPRTTGKNDASIENYFAVEPSTTYTYSDDKGSFTNANIYVAEYDSSKTFIKVTNIGLSKRVQTFTTDSTTAFIRVHFYANNVTWTSIIPSSPMIEKGSVATSFVPHFVYLDDSFISTDIYNEILNARLNYDYNDCDSVGDAIREQANEIANETKNIVIGEFVNGSISTSTGAFTPLTTGTNNTSNPKYFKVDSSTQYVISGNIANINDTNLYVFEYDENKNFISNTSSLGDLKYSNPITFTTFATTKFVRIMIYKNATNYELMIPDEFQIEKGSTPTDYQVHRIINPDMLSDDIENHINEKHKITSRNILNVTWKNARLDANGAFLMRIDGVDGAAEQEYLSVDEDETYILSWIKNKTFSLLLYIFEYDSTKTFLRSSGAIGVTNTDRYTLITGDDTAYIRLMYYTPVAGTPWQNLLLDELCIELGSYPTPYVKNKVLSGGEVDAKDIYKRINDRILLKKNFELPQYYMRNSYINNKIATINNLCKTNLVNGDAFIFITDMHLASNQHNSFPLIQMISRQTPITKLFNGGDNDNGLRYADNEDDYMRSAFDGDIYQVMGNHEYFYPMTGAELYYNYRSRTKDCVCGVQERNYYYVDNIQTKIRYVVLSPFEAGRTSEENVRTLYEEEQQTWLTNVALDVPSGWGIVILIHTLWDINHSDSTLFVTVGGRGAQTYIDALDAYDGEGDILFIIQGHAHKDRMTHTPGGIPAILTTCDKNIPYTTPYGAIDNDVDRTTGTINEQAFDVVIFNRVTRKIYAVRIGAGARNGFDDDGEAEQVEIRELDMKPLP